MSIKTHGQKPVSFVLPQAMAKWFQELADYKASQNQKPDPKVDDDKKESTDAKPK